MNKESSSTYKPALYLTSKCSALYARACCYLSFFCVFCDGFVPVPTQSLSASLGYFSSRHCRWRPELQNFYRQTDKQTNRQTGKLSHCLPVWGTFHLGTAAGDQSCKMSQIWQLDIYLCKELEGWVEKVGELIKFCLQTNLLR